MSTLRGVASLVLGASLAWADAAFAADHPAQAFIDYLRAHVINKTFVSESTDMLGGGTVLSKFRSETTYGDLMVSAKGFTFTTVTDIKQTLYDVVDGKPVEPGRVVNRRSSSRDEFGMRAFDRRRVFGFGQSLANPFMDPTGYVTLLTLALADDGLIMKSMPNHPVDCFAAGGGTQPCTTSGTVRIHVVDGLTEMAGDSVSMIVDPDTYEPLSENARFSSLSREMR